MVDTVRGVLRVRKWPKKRGKPTSARQLFWIDWFKQANLLAKYVDGATAALAIKLTKGSGLYPRDIILQAMRGRLYWWTDDTGRSWYPVAAIEDVSKTFDVLAQTVGSVLVRATDRWRAAVGGVLGDVLVHAGPGAPPTWGAAGVDVSQQQLAESPITPANTVSQYVFDVSIYLDVDLTIDDVDLNASDNIKAQFSTDGGATYKAGATDYGNMLVDEGTIAAVYGVNMGMSDGSAAVSHMLTMEFRNLRTLRTSWTGMCGLFNLSARARTGYTRFAGPITHLKIFTGGGQNFKSGKIRAFGSKAG